MRSFSNARINRNYVNFLTSIHISKKLSLFIIFSSIKFRNIEVKKDQFAGLERFFS